MTEFEFRGEYYPTFFSILLNGEYSNNLEELAPEDLGTFAHEYCHYLQNISTICGIATSQYFFIFTNELLSYIGKKAELTLPINEFDLSETTSINRKNITKYKGYAQPSINVVFDNILIEVSKDDIVVVKLFNSTVLVREFDFGYACVKEGMAHYFQKKFNSSIVHKTLPYLALELMCKKINPDILEEENKIIVLAYLALSNINSGKSFYELLLKSKNYNHLTAKELLYKLAEEMVLSFQGKKWSISDLQYYSLTKLEEVLKNNIESETIYFDKIFHNLKLAFNGEIDDFIGILLQDENTDVQKLNEMRELFGIPHIRTLNGFNYFMEDSIELKELIGQRLVMSRFNSAEPTCSFIGQCQLDSNDVVDDNCYGEQWNRDEDCPFLLTFNNWNLKGKIKSR